MELVNTVSMSGNLVVALIAMCGVALVVVGGLGLVITLIAAVKVFSPPKPPSDND